MSKRVKPWWIIERHNPQLKVYFVGLGQLSKTAAKRHGRPIYGTNYVHEYPTEADYKAKLAELKKKGNSVQ